MAKDNVSVAPLKPIRFEELSATFDRRSDGVVYVHPTKPLGRYETRFSDPLQHFGETAPERVLFAERVAGDWRKVSWGEALGVIRRIGSALLTRKLSAERPVMVLSGNSVDHGLISLAAQYVGIASAAVSPAYSLTSKDFGKLKHAVALLTPGLVFVEDGEAYATALAAAVPVDTEVVVSRRPPAGRKSTTFAELAAMPEAAGIDDARLAVSPDTILKFLLTSGSTGLPKAVINTNRMLCANQAMVRQTMRFIEDEPPVFLDWLPWNHTFGGNHNTGVVIFNGGSMYIDDGRPLPGAIDATARNLREIAPTIYFNVPKGFEALVPHLKSDAVMRRNFFSRLKASFFAGAGLSAHIWRELDEIAVAETGYRMPMLTGLGSTETAPFSVSVTPATSRSGHVGLPVPGNSLKLVANAGKFEARVKGDNVTPGYWRQPDLTAAAFDDEGFYLYGDALKPADPDDYSKGFDFDGRVAEDFKLASGTWVSVGPLRVRLIGALAPFARDAVIAGINRDGLAAILIPDVDGVRTEFPELPANMPLAALMAHPPLREAVRAKLARFAANSTGSSTQVDRLILLDEPPSIDKGEITDKGSINQRAVLEHRAKDVADLYASAPSARVIVA